jgi:hypothetical protein
MPTKKKAAKKPERVPVALKPITGREMAFAHEMMSGEGTTLDMAAELAGIPKENAQAVWNSNRVRRYCNEYSSLVAQEMARRTAADLKKVDITPESVVMNLYALSKTPAHLTKGTITGQVEASRVILEALHALGDIPSGLKGKTQEQLDNFAKYGTFDKPPATSPAKVN